MKNILICTHERWITEEGNIPLIENFLNKKHKLSTKNILLTGYKIPKLNKNFYEGKKYYFLNILIRAFLYCIFNFKIHFFKIKLKDYIDWIGEDFYYNFSKIRRVKAYFEIYLMIFFVVPYLRIFCKKFDEIILICGYDRIHSTIIYSANLAYVKTTELQHGNINADSSGNCTHPCYAKASKMKLITPSRYVLWDQKYLKGFDKDLDYKKFLFCKPNVRNKSKTNKKIKVLVAFDNYMPIPKTLFELIKKNPSVQFFLRPHPKTQILRLLFVKYKSYEYDNAIFNSFKTDIYKVIEMVDFCIVDSSSVALISEFYNKLSFYYNKNHLIKYSDPLPKSKLIKYVDKQKLLYEVSKYIEDLKNNNN